MSDTLWRNFESHFAKIDAVQGVVHQLHWDMQTLMPKGGAAYRARQLEVLETHAHELATDPAYLKSLEELNASGLADPVRRKAVEVQLKKARRKTRVPASLVAELSVALSRGHESWIAARAANRFEDFAPALENILALRRREGECLREGAEPAYEALMGQYDPEVPLAFVKRVFAEMKPDLVPLIGEIVERQKSRPAAPEAFPLDPDRQRAVNLEALRALGFDFDRGRLDVSVHPFCGGSGSDIRITTRYEPDYALSSLTGVIHECGHALYEQGMERLAPHRALREHAGMAVHESQSRFYENVLGRSRAFCEWFPKHLETKGLRPDWMKPEELHRELTRVSRSLIRVEADEATYNLHILLRFEIESGLVDGAVSVRDLPGLWREKMKEYLGVVPATDVEGVLQDIHWSGGAFGYFPSYALGNLISAQLRETMRSEVDLEADASRGEFGRVRDWLNRRVHAHGNAYAMPELVRKVTGRDLDHRAFAAYLRERYLKD